MAVTTSKGTPTHSSKPKTESEAGRHVAFGYRGAHPHGTVTGVAKVGKTKANTMYDVMPDAKDRHPGEKLPVHRLGKNLHG